MGRLRAFLSIVIVLLLVGSCSSEPDDTAPELRKIVYLTAFGAAGRDAFAWIAQQKGYFREAGLDVEIQLGAATGENLKTLAAGRVQFANNDLIGGIILAGKGTYPDFRAIAAIHQETLVSIVAPKDGPVRKPADLSGKTLGAATGSVNQLLFPAYAKKAGLDAGTVKWVNASPQQVPALMASGRVDALSTFLIGRPGVEKAAGKPMTVLPYSEFLPELFGNAIITSTKLIADDPDLVRRFRDAALKGLQYTLEHPDEAAALLHQKNPASAAESAKGEIALMTPYTKPAAGQPLGSIDQARVTTAIGVLVETGLIPPGLTADKVVEFPLTPR
ncbi:ABC transporter substrate-binding protein [Actinoplanes sp. NPDC051470]|uniref:ABC transporter substrate-binding protein n=1 Tax=unclassified Actinoplanes TaxID=2626549 RepID=UPI00343705F2